jgi:hypothetical protein
VDSEECLNIGEGMRKNLRVEKTFTRFVLVSNARARKTRESFKQIRERKV